jgi:hypothetical protein
MPCPVCNLPIGHPAADHRMCVFNLLRSGTIKTVPEWEVLSSDAPAKPVTIYKGRIKAVLPKE